MTTIAGTSELPLLIVVSIDTEEDSWDPSADNGHVSNISALPELHRTFEAFGVRPTYFTSYQVANVPWARAILRDLASDGAAEIGAHLHPWNTPPFREARIPRHTMMKNLPEPLQAEKLRVLTNKVGEIVGSPPRSFRAGRFGIGPTGARLLADAGYEVDSSVTPFLDWRRYDDGPDHRMVPLGAYRPSLTDIARPADDGPIAELPLSIGYTRRPFTRWFERHQQLVRTRVGPISLGSVAYHTRFVRKVQLSFETDTVHDMLVLTRQFALEGARFVQLSWHSPSMVPGLSPFARSPAHRDRLRASIDQYFERLSATMAFSFATVGEAALELAPPHIGSYAHVGHR